MSLESERRQMVDTQIRGRGIQDPVVLEAFSRVERERFLPERLAEFAYSDSPLPIEEGQTISQPYVVALMVEALKLRKGDRVLEVGTGSGYAAAILACMVDEVFTIERHENLANAAREHLSVQGYDNVQVRCGDGSLGWREAAPFDAIIVAAGGSNIPDALLEQLAMGGRLVIPVGATQRMQSLVRVTRKGKEEFSPENLGSVSFVPLIGAQGWRAAAKPRLSASGLSSLIRECAQPIDRIESVELGPLLDRIGDASVVLLGEATHGTSEFYRMRTRITQELVLRRGFTVVAVEADWPDASQIDRYVRHRPPETRNWTPFSRFPQWMWRNREALELVEWLRVYNEERGPRTQEVSFCGLDLYSLYTSISEVLRYLDRVHPPTAAIARERYGRLTPWESDPEVYGRVVLSGEYRSCEDEVVDILTTLLERRMELTLKDGAAFFDATQNAYVIKEAEAYYRTMYYGGPASWNLRDQHMFDTLKRLMAQGGEGTKVVVWEHNSHIGNAQATEMHARGEHNIGSLLRLESPDQSYHVGFGTDHGVVAAASNWDGPMENMQVRPAHERSYERLCHDSRVPAFLLHLFEPQRAALRDELMQPRLERAIGVIYRPESELRSHYFEATLPEQFDEYIWFDETRAITPLGPEVPHGAPKTYPFVT